jgi:hypothetical protein
VPWRRWDNGPPGGLLKTPGGAPVFATAGGHGDGDEVARAAEIERVSKALEACAPLLGPKNEAVLGLQKQLEELNAAKPKAMPMHVEVGKFQKKLKQVEQKLVRLSQKLADAALAILDKQNEIIETDDEIKKTKKEFAELHAKLASIGRRSSPETAVPTIDDLGMQDAAPELKRRAALLLRRLCTIVAEAEADEHPVEEEEPAPPAPPAPAKETVNHEPETKVEQTGEALAEKVGKAIQAANQVLMDRTEGYVPRVVLPPGTGTECQPTQLVGDSQASTIPAGQPTPGTPVVTPHPHAPGGKGKGASGFDCSAASSPMEDELDGEALDDIELFEEDLEAELLAEEYKEAPNRKRRATAAARMAAEAGKAGSAAAAALSMSEAIVQAAIANGRAGLSRG